MSKIQAFSRALKINNEIQALSRPAGDPDVCEEVTGVLN